jgi:hypothetical protein
MRYGSFFSLPLLMGLSSVLSAQSGGPADAELIRSALSAGPASVTLRATVVGPDQRVLRAGDNGWVCMPDPADVPNNSPMCLDEGWREFMDAYMNKREPSISGLSFGYMLQGDFPVSNNDPFATGPTADNQWVPDSGPHIMMIVSDQTLLDSMTEDPTNGGPWVMWKGTPYAHVMIPAVASTP